MKAVCRGGGCEVDEGHVLKVTTRRGLCVLSLAPPSMRTLIVECVLYDRMCLSVKTTKIALPSSCGLQQPP